MFLYLLLYILRIFEPIGEFSNLPVLDSSESVKNFIKNGTHTILFYLSEDSSYPMDFANFGITKNKKKIQFAKVPFAVSQELNISNLPEIIGYRKDKIFSDMDLVHNAVSFSAYCRRLLGPEVINLNSPEELRLLLESHKTVVIGVDGAEKPKNWPKDEIFYETQSRHFKVLNITVTSGVYVYRPADRQLVPARSNYKMMMKTKVADLSQVDLSKRPFVAGYFVDTANNEQTNREIQILHRLSDKYPNDFYFAPLLGHLGSTFFTSRHFDHFKVPFFAVMKTNETNSRWAVLNQEQLHDYDYLCNFVERISKGEEPSRSISEESNISDPMKIVNREFMSKILSHKGENIIAFLRDDISDVMKIRATCVKAQEILKNNNVKFYFFDVLKNDYPPIVSARYKAPFLVQISPGGKVTVHNRGFSIDELVETVAINSISKFPAPKFDVQAARNEIVQMLASNNKPEEEKSKEL